VDEQFSRHAAQRVALASQHKSCFQRPTECGEAKIFLERQKLGIEQPQIS